MMRGSDRELDGSQYVIAVPEVQGCTPKSWRAGRKQCTHSGRHPVNEFNLITGKVTQVALRLRRNNREFKCNLLEYIEGSVRKIHS
jgi:hypothetical protein